MIDISVPLDHRLPVWPGSPGFRVSPLITMGGDSVANVSHLAMELHTGTHIDAPRHFVADGATVEDISIDALVGPAWVALSDVDGAIGPPELEALDLPAKVDRLLLRTPNSALWAKHPGEFQEDYAALSLEGARWIVDRGIRLFGIDYLSVQRFSDGPETHQVLLKAGVVLLESLNLSAVEPGAYELICLPLALVGTEAAPARAFLRPLGNDPDPEASTMNVRP
ncbi:MAG: cyclase family protein [Deltaproteobacteria bacterium]|nr:cyclase family protein [Deltaproteobacteria bacterium]